MNSGYFFIRCFVEASYTPVEKLTFCPLPILTNYFTQKLVIPQVNGTWWKHYFKVIKNIIVIKSFRVMDYRSMEPYL